MVSINSHIPIYIDSKSDNQIASQYLFPLYMVLSPSCVYICKNSST